MAKKFDIKSTLNMQPKQLSVEEIESATKQIHHPAPVSVAPKKAAEPILKGKRGPKPKVKTVETPVLKAEKREPEMPIAKKRVSVDVFPTTHKRLKIKAIEHDMDLMRYVEMLIERDLAQ